MSEALPDLDALFCAALEIASAEERAAYLDRACGGDLERRRRLQKLLSVPGLPQVQSGGFASPCGDPSLPPCGAPGCRRTGKR